MLIIDYNDTLYYTLLLELLIHTNIHLELDSDELSDQGYTSLPKSDKIESGKMVLK